MILRLACVLGTWTSVIAAQPLIPLTDIGAGNYQGFPGGLYPGGANSPPVDHAVRARLAAERIRPLGPDGSPDPDGLIGLVTVGMSNTTQEFGNFERRNDLATDRRGDLVLINTAVPSQPVESTSDPASDYWTIVRDRIAAAGISPAQVQVAWLKQAVGQPSTTAFPEHAEFLRDRLRDTVHNMLDEWPNLRIVYISSRIYGGYTTRPDRGEPISYESGFAVKWLIESQISGDPSLNADPQAGPVRAPVLLWGPYLWANGNQPRSDGLVWLPSDYSADMIHPSPAGEAKVGDMLMEFFRTDPSAVWHRPSPGVRSLVMEASDDATIDQTAPGQNFGMLPQLSVLPGQRRSLIRFPSSEPFGSIAHAKLSLRPAGSTADIALHASGPEWSESTVTAANAPAPQAFLGRIPGPANTFSMDTTDALRLHPGGPVAFTMIGSFGNASGYRSRETGDGPRLVMVVRCPPDWNNDARINFFDLAAFLDAFRSRARTTDLNGDGSHDFFDLAAYLAAYTQGC